MSLSPWLVFVLVALAGARTFRLLAFDDIAQPVRIGFNRLIDRLPDWLGTKIYDGFYCPWCFGYWYTAGWAITALAWHDTILWQLLAISFAANYVAAVLNGLYDVVHETAEEKMNDD